MIKIPQARLQQYMNHELPDVQLDLEKAEEPEIKLPTSIGSLRKHESSRKKSTSALLTMPKPLTVWITINCGKFWKRWEYQTTPFSLHTHVCICTGLHSSSQHLLNHWKSMRVPEKNLLLLYWLCQSLWLCGSLFSKNCGKFFKRWDYQTTWPASWEICMQVRKQ